jgi:hypothetical protein
MTTMTANIARNLQGPAPRQNTYRAHAARNDHFIRPNSVPATSVRGRCFPPLSCRRSVLAPDGSPTPSSWAKQRASLLSAPDVAATTGTWAESCTQSTV